MLAKHHHVDSQKIEQVDVGSMDILNETKLITNPYECDKSTKKTLESCLCRLLCLVSRSSHFSLFSFSFLFEIHAGQVSVTSQRRDVGLMKGCTLYDFNVVT